MALRACIVATASDDLGADMARLRAAGDAFLSEPASVTLDQRTTTFVCFKDPDGTILEATQTV